MQIQVGLFGWVWKRTGQKVKAPLVRGFHFVLILSGFSCQKLLRIVSRLIYWFFQPPLINKAQEVRNHNMQKTLKNRIPGYWYQNGIVRCNASQEHGSVIILVTKNGLIGWADLKRLAGYQKWIGNEDNRWFWNNKVFIIFFVIPSPYLFRWPLHLYIRKCQL